MNWRTYFQMQTRNPAFLWRMVIWTISLGVVSGGIAQYWYQPHPFVKSATTSDSHSWEEIEQLAQQGEWSRVWWSIPKYMLDDYQATGPVVLAIIAGCCWLVFLLQTVRVNKLLDWKLWGATCAVALGIFSIWLTWFFIAWQEFHWQLEASMELVPGLRYFILGVGLREEAAKLLCLLPLMPLFIKQRNELAVLILSACVGLGFAIEENIGYFAATKGQASLGRFLTANPFHMTLTGMIGLAVYRAFLYPRDWIPQAIATFGLMVVAHGVYDALAILPELADYSIGSLIVFSLVVFQFFRELRQLRKSHDDPFSLTATFLLGVSLVTSATFIYLSATLGCQVAFDSLVSGIVGLSLMVYLFLREMPETMVTV